MPTLASRVTELERLADRLVDRGPPLSDLLKQARVRAQRRRLGGGRVSEALALTPEHDLPGKAVVFETLKVDQGRLRLAPFYRRLPSCLR